MSRIDEEKLIKEMATVEAHIEDCMYYIDRAKEAELELKIWLKKQDEIFKQMMA